MSGGKFSFTADLSLEVLFLILPRCCLVMHGDSMVTGSYMPSALSKTFDYGFSQ